MPGPRGHRLPAAWVLLLCAFLLLLLPPAAPTPRRASYKPVIVVHGLFDSSYSFRHLLEYINEVCGDAGWRALGVSAATGGGKSGQPKVPLGLPGPDTGMGRVGEGILVPDAGEWGGAAWSIPSNFAPFPQTHPGTVVTVLDLFDGRESLRPLWEQVQGFREAVVPIMAKAPQGVHLICYSQGRQPLPHS